MTTAMTAEGKALLGKTIRGLRERLLKDLGDALQAEYRLGIAAGKAKLPQAQAKRRERLDAWVAEQVKGATAGKAGGKGKGKAEAEAATEARFRAEVVKTAAYTWLNRLVYLRLHEAAGLQSTAVVTGGWRSRGYQDFRDLAPGLVSDETEGYAFLLRLVFDELALELPGLFGRVGIAELVPMPAATLRAVVEALDDPGLASCWGDDMTLGWVYQYWNDPEREALDDKLNAGGKVEPHEIASKTQMFTERYMVDWLLQNSVGPLWLALCKKHGWVPEVEADGTLARLEARRVEWRRKRDAGEVALTELMPLETEAERRWAYYVPQPIPAGAVETAAESVREWKVLDPAVGSGHFLVVALELLVALYREEARHRGEAGEERWSDRAIVERVVEENLWGIDLDPRAVQIAAAALWLKGKGIARDARPGRVNLVASQLRLAGLPEDDPGLVTLEREVERETGIEPALTQRIVRALQGADHLGSLLKVDRAVDDALREYEAQLGRAVAEQGGLFDGFAEKQERVKITPEAAKATVLGKLEGFLAAHSGSEDLGLRLLGEQLAAGVRFVRMVREGTYDLVVGNPPYQGTSKMSDAGYVQKMYPRGKADLYAAFLERGLELARDGGVSALLTMRSWMFLKQYAGLRKWLLETWDLRSLIDLDSGAFEEINAAQVVVSVVGSIFRRSAPSPSGSVGLMPFDRATVTSSGETGRKRARVLCQSEQHHFSSVALRDVPEWPLVYWWSAADLDRFLAARGVGSLAPVRNGLSTQDNKRFLRLWHEVAPLGVSILDEDQIAAGADVYASWVPYVKGASGAAWFEPLHDIIPWHHNGAVLKIWIDWYKIRVPGMYIKSQQYYFRRGIAFSPIGNHFSARLHRHIGIFGHMGASVFPRGEQISRFLCCLNSLEARKILADLNPGVHFNVGDVNRLPLFPVANAQEIFATIESAFTTHESHREPSVEFRTPGPSCWQYAQAWAQQAVDRPEGEPLPPWQPEYEAPHPTTFVSYALGIALGRFHPDGTGILDPTTTPAALAHALPAGILFLDGTLDADAPHDSLGHAAAAPLHLAWSTHGPSIAPKRTLRDYLRLDFFADVHRPMYENRPIHFPLSSDKRTFVAWISIHRWSASTLRTLLADHLHPALTRLEGQLADLRASRDAGDAKAARAAEKRLGPLQKSRDELDRFIADVTQCAELGPPPPDAKTPAREADAPYDPDLDDGVMINAAALYPLLQPQWKDPAKHWKELATASGRKDYDWSHLAARYFPSRVDAKCRTDPSLAVAHRCFWQYHPERAYAWELRLQDEISPDFTLDEPGSHEHRTRFLAEHPDLAAELRAKEAKRRERKANKPTDDQGELFDADAEPPDDDSDDPS